MRTYQRVNAGDGVAAVGNSLIVGTAIIWVPLVVVFFGWNILSQKLEIGDYSPKVVEQQRIAELERKQEQYRQLTAVYRDAAGNITGTNESAPTQRVEDVLPMHDKHAPKQGWLVSTTGYVYALSNGACFRQVGDDSPWKQYRYTLYRGKTYDNVTKVGSGCYAIRNGVIGIENNGVQYFDVKDATEGFFLTDAEARALGAKAKPVAKASAKPAAPAESSEVAEARRAVAKAKAVCNELYPIYRGTSYCPDTAGANLKAAQNNYARAKLPAN